MTAPDFSGHRLGKRPPIEKRALMLADVLTGAVPAVPAVADHFVNVAEWDLGRNDQFGTCGPTSVANSLRLVTAGLTGHMVSVSFDDIADLYRRSGNPGFDPSKPDGGEDNGVIMQTMLEALLSGGLGGHRPMAFAKIAAGDMDTLDKAIAIFGAVNLGLDLSVAQQTQRVWSHVAGSAPWGGHAVLAGRYANPDGDDNDRSGIITWAEVVDMDRGFVHAQEDECWVIIWPEHLGSAAFLEGVDVRALASAYEELTGRPFPVPAEPVPAPEPAPAPDGGADADLEKALRRILSGKSAPRYLRSAAQHWLDARA